MSAEGDILTTSYQYQGMMASSEFGPNELYWSSPVKAQI